MKNFKIVLVGDSSVGKSSIIERISKNSFSEQTISTLGCATTELTIKLNNEEDIKLNIWDTAGQEKYRSLSSIYFRNASLAIVVFDISNLETLNSYNFWLKSFEETIGENSSVILFGNKIDKIENQVELIKIIKKIEKKFNTKVFLISAKNGDGINDAFKYIGQILNIKNNNESNTTLIIKEESKSCC